jgi:hypothetical protein
MCSRNESDFEIRLHAAIRLVHDSLENISGDYEAYERLTAPSIKLLSGSCYQST